MNCDQFGLRENHSTTQQLFKITDTILSNKQNNHLSLGPVSLGVVKVFDTIYAGGLIHKLHEMKFPPDSSNSSKTTPSTEPITSKPSINQRPHAPSPPESRKDQSSDPSFSLYISTPTDRKISNALYADDTAIVTTSHSIIIISTLLQNHLNERNEYFIESGPKVNVDKCQAILFTPKTHPTTQTRPLQQETRLRTNNHLPRHHSRQNPNIPQAHQRRR